MFTLIIDSIISPIFIGGIIGYLLSKTNNDLIASIIILPGSIALTAYFIYMQEKTLTMGYSKIWYQITAMIAIISFLVFFFINRREEETQQKQT